MTHVIPTPPGLVRDLEIAAVAVHKLSVVADLGEYYIGVPREVLKADALAAVFRAREHFELVSRLKPPPMPAEFISGAVEHLRGLSARISEMKPRIAKRAGEVGDYGWLCRMCRRIEHDMPPEQWS